MQPILIPTAHFAPRPTAHFRPEPDRIGLVGFHATAHILSKPLPATDSSLAKAISTLGNHINSYTNIAAGLRTAGEMLRCTPRGTLRRVWLLSDGEATHEENEIIPIARVLRTQYTNINTVGFGDKFDESTLRQIAAATHSGRFYSVSDLQQLTAALAASYRPDLGAHLHHRRSEHTIFCIDLSPSMQQRMGQYTKIKTAQTALLQLLNWKQTLFA
jgi:Mg-chelatase subunit ChlD